MDTANELRIPIELMKDKQTLTRVLQYLRLYEKLLEGKTVSSTEGFRNKFKHYILGYLLVQHTEICDKCGAPMALEKTDDKGTVVAFSVEGKLSHPKKTNSAIFRNAKMDFKWLYFKCPKCGWGHVRPDR